MFTSNDDLARIARGIADTTLPRADWTHAAHFAAALWMLRAGTIDALPDTIRRYNVACGTENTDTTGYHETITRASIRAASAFLEGQAPDAPLWTVANALMATPLGRSDWMLAYWRRERLFSAEARRTWVEPDVKPLPW
jgi:hypothetical protein